MEIRQRKGEMEDDRLNETVPSTISSVHANPSKPFSVEDSSSLALLLLLYTLQGIPMGLGASLPLILKEKGADFNTLSLFSLVSLPFSLKLLWAPLVDSIYLPSVGRRKTWLIPTQFVTGAVMIWGSLHLDLWMSGPGGSQSINATALTLYFAGLYFLMATQDIAVDGWALTMLTKENVSYASICNSIGQSLGVFIANQGYIALSDATFCRRFLFLSDALVTLPGFMSFWGWFFVAITAAVCILKREVPIASSDEPDGLVQTYLQVKAVLMLKNVRLLCSLLFTIKIAFAAADSVFIFKLTDYGISKSDIAGLSSFLILVGFIVPAALSEKLRVKPLSMLVYGFILKLLTSGLCWVAVQIARSNFEANIAPSSSFFAPLLGLLFVHEIAGTVIFISMMSFFSRVADPSIGGTYMTLLNTISNLGSIWPRSLILWLYPRVSVVALNGSFRFGSCQDVPDNLTCEVLFDGFTVEMAALLVVGIVWVVYCHQIVNSLQASPSSDWLVGKTDKDKK